MRGDRPGAGPGRTEKRQPHRTVSDKPHPGSDPQVTHLELWVGGGGLGFVPKALPELGRGKRAGPTVSIVGLLPVPVNTSVGRSGPLGLRVPSPVSKAGAPRSPLGSRGTGAGRSRSTRGGGKGAFSLRGGPQWRTIPTLLWLPGHNVGMRWGIRKQDTVRDHWPSPCAGPVPGAPAGRVRSELQPLPARPGEILGIRLPSRAGQAWTLGCHGNGFWSLRTHAEPPSSRVPPQLPGLAGSEGFAGMRAHSTCPGVLVSRCRGVPAAGQRARAQVTAADPGCESRHPASVWPWAARFLGLSLRLPDCTRVE